MIAFTLDIELRESTDLKVGFEDFFKRMYCEFNSDFYATERTKYGYRDIVDIASDLAGKDLSGLFERYVSGSDVIPMEIYFDKLGLEIRPTRRARSVSSPWRRPVPGSRRCGRRPKREK